METETAVASFTVNTANGAPSEPAISSPTHQNEINAMEIDLAVANASDPNGDPLSYRFEIDTADTFDTAGKRESGGIAEGAGVTVWHVTDLVENTWYYWQAKASDGAADSLRAVGAFFVNTANKPPPTPPRKVCISANLPNAS